MSYIPGIDSKSSAQKRYSVHAFENHLAITPGQKLLCVIMHFTISCDAIRPWMKHNEYTFNWKVLESYWKPNISYIKLFPPVAFYY